MNEYQSNLNNACKKYKERLILDNDLKSKLPTIINTIANELKNNQKSSLTHATNTVEMIKEDALKFLNLEKSKYNGILNDYKKKIKDLEFNYVSTTKETIISKLKADLDKVTFDKSNYIAETKNYNNKISILKRDLLLTHHLIKHIDELITDIKKQDSSALRNKIERTLHANYSQKKDAMIYAAKNAGVGESTDAILKFFNNIKNTKDIYSNLETKKDELIKGIFSSIISEYKTLESLKLEFRNAITTPFALDSYKEYTPFNYKEDHFYIGYNKTNRNPAFITFSKTPIFLYDDGQEEIVANILSNIIHQATLTMAPSPGINFSIYSQQGNIQRFDGGLSNLTVDPKWPFSFGDNRVSFFTKYEDFSGFSTRLKSRFQATENFEIDNRRRDIKIPYEFAVFLLKKNIGEDCISLFEKINQSSQDHGFLSFMAVHINKKDELCAKLDLEGNESFKILDLPKLSKNGLEIEKVIDFGKENNPHRCIDFIMNTIFYDDNETTSDVVVKYGKTDTTENDFSVTYRADALSTIIHAESGFGKSTLLHHILHSIFAYDEQHTKVYAFDFKFGSELGEIVGVPNVDFLYSGLDVEILNQILKKIIREATERSNLINKYKKFDFVKLNEAIDKGEIKGIKRLPRIFIIVDEFQEITRLNNDDGLRNEVADAFRSISKLLRSVGYHLILSCQKDDVDRAKDFAQIGVDIYIDSIINRVSHGTLKRGTTAAGFTLNLNNLYNDIRNYDKFHKKSHDAYAIVTSGDNTFIVPENYPKANELLNIAAKNNDFNLSCGIDLSDYKKILNISFIKETNQHLLIQGECDRATNTNMAAMHYWNMLLYSFYKWENSSKKMIILDENRILDEKSPLIEKNPNINYYKDTNSDDFKNDFQEWYIQGKSNSAGSKYENIFFVALSAETSLSKEIPKIEIEETDKNTDDSLESHNIPSLEIEPTDAELDAYFTPEYMAEMEDALGEPLTKEDKIFYYKKDKEREANANKLGQEKLSEERNKSTVNISTYKEAISSIITSDLYRFSKNGAYLILSTNSPSRAVNMITERDVYGMPNFLRVISFTYNNADKIQNFIPTKSHLFGTFQMPSNSNDKRLFYPFDLTNTIKDL